MKTERLVVDIQGDISEFKRQLLIFSQTCNYFALLDSNSNHDGLYADYEYIAGLEALDVLKTDVNALQSLQAFSDFKKDWLFGFLTYDLKDELDGVKSLNNNKLSFPALLFFQARYVFVCKDEKLYCLYNPNEDSGETVLSLISKIKQAELKKDTFKYPKITARTSRTEYIRQAKKLQKHILRGDIYELNYCIEFFSESAYIQPVNVFLDLERRAPMPFASYFKANHYYALSASPERFLKKQGQKIISQPIKGTVRRGVNSKEDDALMLKLKNNPKERAENVMIVDLVRNDLSRSASPASVRVEELFGVYKFRPLFQMISTVSCNVDMQVPFIQVIKDCFPPGSMTGAPKISAMKLIERYEKSRRDLYAGSIGYITPNQDFDFNVVIRTILYNSENHYLSFSTGSALTCAADVEKEYEECMLKAQTMIDVLKN